jgi:hypothetical protein
VSFALEGPVLEGALVRLEPLDHRHAFEEWGVSRVDLKTDARNSRSRAAIESVR